MNFDIVFDATAKVLREHNSYTSYLFNNYVIAICWKHFNWLS